MRSPAAAILWELRHKHRWGLIGLAAALLALATIKLWVLGSGRSFTLDDESMALAGVLPLTATVLYFLGVFSYGLAGDLAARASIYPARLLTLPVTTDALAGWPMLYGSVAMVILWVAMRLVVVWPPDVVVPVVWPALLAASLLAWTQALTWMPYPLPGLRVIVTVIWMMVFDAIVMLALELEATEPVMLALLAPHVPLAYLTARFALGRARRGEVPDWRDVFGWPGRTADVPSRSRDHFRSPARAQEWLEWRRYGRSLPAMVAIVLPLELALLYLFRSTPALVLETVLTVLFTPPIMAAFAAAAVSKSSPRGSDVYDLAPFIATKPIDSASLVAAKLKATMWSTLAAWLVVAVAVPLGLILSGTWPILAERFDGWVDIGGRPRVVAILLLVVAALMASTWKQLVQGLFVGLSGREWVVKASLFGVLGLLAILIPTGHWILSSKPVMAALWMSAPWILAALVGLKVSAALFTVWHLRGRRLLADRTLVVGAACWDVAVLALYGLLSWIVPTLIIPRAVLALVAILEVPLARLAAAPLALAWNRHR